MCVSTKIKDTLFAKLAKVFLLDFYILIYHLRGMPFPKDQVHRYKCIVPFGYISASQPVCTFRERIARDSKVAPAHKFFYLILCTHAKPFTFDDAKVRTYMPKANPKLLQDIIMVENVRRRTLIFVRLLSIMFLQR